MTTSHDVKIAILEQDMIQVKKELSSHGEVQTQVLNILTDIRMEISGFKGAVKMLTMCMGAGIVIVAAAFAINWIQIPSVQHTPQEVVQQVDVK